MKQKTCWGDTMTLEDAVMDVCNKYSECAKGCPLKIVGDNYTMNAHYCQKGYEQEAITVLTGLGYTIDKEFTINESDITAIFEE